MSEPPYILAIDQGTTSTRAILFDVAGKPLAMHSIELRQIYPNNGWVEHEPEDIWQAVMACCRVVTRGVDARDIAGIGITNQRETTLIWDRKTGRAIHNAIVWQDRRTAERCHALRLMGLEGKITAITGLVLDPYFSATKAEWLLDNIPQAFERAKDGLLAFGTVDSWLIWKLTGGAVHATDVTNASRTLLLDLRTLTWNDDLLTLFEIPRAILPDVRDSAGDFGWTASGLFGAPLRILGVAGDQQAAAIGQACFAPGDIKATYGTGCFALVNTGAAVPSSQNRLLATCAYRIGGRAVYAVEGSIFAAGAVVQWLRDGLGVIRQASEIEALARSAKDAEGLYFVPAFTGLGAPYWDPDARAAITGLTRDMGAAEIAHAALDAVCHQTRALVDAMARDLRAAKVSPPTSLKVDGGMVTNNWFCQRLADLSGLTVERPRVVETTALGVSHLVRLGAGLFRDTSDIAAGWELERRFEPSLAAAKRDLLYDGWNAAVARTTAV
jgi:glycerol kinase